jgi:hypothetical protein
MLVRLNPAARDLDAALAADTLSAAKAVDEDTGLFGGGHDGGALFNFYISVFR